MKVPRTITQRHALQLADTPGGPQINPAEYRVQPEEWSCATVHRFMRRIDSQFDRGDVWENYDDGTTISDGHVVQPIHDMSRNSSLQYFMNRQFADTKKKRESSDTRFVIRRSAHDERKVVTSLRKTALG